MWMIKVMQESKMMPLFIMSIFRSTFLIFLASLAFDKKQPRSKWTTMIMRLHFRKQKSEVVESMPLILFSGATVTCQRVPILLCYFLLYKNGLLILSHHRRFVWRYSKVHAHMTSIMSPSSLIPRSIEPYQRPLFPVRESRCGPVSREV